MTNAFPSWVPGQYKDSSPHYWRHTHPKARWYDLGPQAHVVQPGEIVEYYTNPDPNYWEEVATANG